MTDRAATLLVETTAADDLRQLMPMLDPRSPLLWLRKGQGLAGLGEALRLEFRGPGRMTEAARVWREVAARAQVEDPLRRAGTGLVAFGSFAFDDESERCSVLVVPRVVIGRRDGVTWVTRIRAEGDEQHPSPAASIPLGPEYRLRLLPGRLGPDAFREAVATAVARIRSGAVEKVVLARDVTGHVPAGADLRRPLVDLALGYPDCWTFAIDGFLGSSPETLIDVDDGGVSARVLAGTISRGADADSDHDQAVALATHRKDQDEHAFAVRSVVDALRPHTSALVTSDLPFTLKLPNLWHLATDIEGRLSDGSTALDLLAALHPTAAVAGTPTDRALRLIRELEPFDRGRYAGPVGWVDGDGDGEWAVALRCAQVDPDGTLTAYAGAGILADSDPEKEFVETRMKFRPIAEAFG